MSLFIGESGLKELTSSIGNLRNLMILSLPDNKLETLPSSISGCKSLEFLNVRLSERKT